MENTKGSAPLENIGDGSINTNQDGSEAPKTVDYAKFQKLLGEKKKEQSEKEALRARLEEIENEKLQSQGKFKELNEGLSKQLNEVKAKERNLHKTYAEKVIKSQFFSEVTKLGCIDPEAAFKLVNLQGVEVKDDFSLDVDGLTAEIGELKKSRSYLFNKEVNAPKDSPPSNKSTKSAVDDLSKLSRDELLNLLK